MIITPKLTARALGWDRNAIGTALKDTPPSGKVALGLIVGVVTGFKEIVDKDTGDVSRGLKGSFKGVSTRADADGVIIEARSGVCYLPGGIQDMIEAALVSAREADTLSMPEPLAGKSKPDSKATITFAITLNAVHATNKAGYSFDADTHQQPSETDPLDALIALARTPEPKALSAPSEDTPVAHKPKAHKPEADKVAA